MQVMRGLANIPAGFSGCVATIGNFDGLHLGHQALLTTLKTQAQALNVPSVVMMFEPQPKEFFAPDKAPARIANLREKLQAFAHFGVDYVLCLPFNQRLRSLPAVAFIEQILVQALKVKHLIVGDDFRFGNDRCGDFHLLQQAGQQYDFAVQNTSTVVSQGQRISSTRVREALAGGDLDLAKQLLGRPYIMSGRVGYGRQLGRQLNTPTANILVKRSKLPLTGVFAVRVQDEHSGERFEGVASVGVKPTITATPEPSLEVHVFDYHGNLYHHHLAVEFIAKIRDEEKFADLTALTAAMNADKQAAKELLRKTINHK